MRSVALSLQTNSFFSSPYETEIFFLLFPAQSSETFFREKSSFKRNAGVKIREKEKNSNYHFLDFLDRKEFFPLSFNFFAT